MNKPITPAFITSARDLLQQPPTTYFIARKETLDLLSGEIKQKMHLHFYGNIGHKQCIVFSLPITSG